MSLQFIYLLCGDLCKVFVYINNKSQYIPCSVNTMLLREAAKKIIYSGPATKALTLLELSGHQIYFLVKNKFQKSFFS